MRVLAIESSTAMLSVAAGDASSIAERCERAGQGHTARVLPLVDAVLASCGWTLRDLDAVAFGAGPGSFTGVRIACAVAQGLALGAGKPVVPVGTLDALAEDAHRAHGVTRVLACLDARMREVYFAALVREDAGWRAEAGPAVTKPAELVVPPGRWFGAGDGFALPGAPSAGVGPVDAALVPGARSVVELARRGLAHGEGVTADEALPLYVRHRVALTAEERAAGARL